MITKIPPKFGFCFQQLTTLNLNLNRISSLPSELIHCSQLQSVDISFNSFVVFPTILLEIDSITDIKAKNNFIADVDDEALEQHPNLELINLEENPLDQTTHARLSRVEGLRIVLTDRRVQEWEDLSC
jgi:Leucine-rich repeat (LRR) protein